MYHFFSSLFEPLSLGLLCALLATMFLWRRRRGRKRLLMILTAILVLLFISCTNYVGHLAMGSLEWRYPPDAQLPDNVDAVVVLSCGMHVLDEEGTSFELGSTSMIRCVKAAEVYHQLGPCLVVVSGGKSQDYDSGPPMAQLMKDFLVRLNVEPNDILVEGTSRTTHENALNTWDMIKNRDLQKIVLVTDATHLLRAQLCFEALGCPVIPVGCDYRATKFPWKLKGFLPSAEGVQKVQRAFHEWLGILWYWINGRFS